MTPPTVAVFRPDDDRLATAVALLESLGARPIADPMLSVVPTGRVPRTDADFVIFTSKTGAELVAGEWESHATICAIGASTADALEAAGIGVDVVPPEFTSAGLVDVLADRVDGSTVEVARSDHGSSVLPSGLWDAGGYVHETVLYELQRPEGAGDSVTMAADGGLDAVLFTSSLTVEHFLAIAEERDQREAVLEGLSEAVVGAIGPPTRETAESHGIDVDVVSETAAFEPLARAVFDRLDS